MANHLEVLKTTDAKSGQIPSSPKGHFGKPGPVGASGARGAHDAIVRLVQQVFVLPGPTSAPGAVAFCGVEGSVGCSWVCARSAEILSEQVTGGVCVVDANLRRPTLHEHFRVDVANGFTDAVKDTRQATNFVKRVGKKNLWLMTAGSLGQEPNGALNPARVHARISELRSQFDYLLFDTPALAAYSDGVVISQATDGAILVIGLASTRRESARKVKENLDAARVPMLGVVLNKRTYPIPEALYRRL